MCWQALSGFTILLLHWNSNDITMILLRNSSSCIFLDFLRIIPLLGTLNAPEILFSFRVNRYKAILIDDLDPPVFPLSVTWNGDLEVSFALRGFLQQWWKRMCFHLLYMNFFLHVISLTNIMCQHGQNGTQLFTLAETSALIESWFESQEELLTKRE